MNNPSEMSNRDIDNNRNNSLSASTPTLKTTTSISQHRNNAYYDKEIILSDDVTTVNICQLHKKQENSSLCQYCSVDVRDQNLNFTEKWDKNTCTKAEKLGTFGLLKFDSWPSTYVAKYVKFQQTTVCTDMIEFIKKGWKLNNPNLILSVVGSAENFHLSSNIRKAFKIGLIKVAKSTGAWIITRGTHVGVTRLVGEAVSESTHRDNLVVMGISNWNNVSNKEKLQVNSKRVTVYKPTREIEHKHRLDPNHSHFVFYDDGNTEKTKPSYEILFRSNIETLFRTETGAVMVMIVVQGGVRVLKLVEQALKNGITVICLQNSQGCADLVIRICTRAKDFTDEGLRNLIYKEFKKCPDEAVDCLKSIRESWKRDKSLVSVYSVGTEDDIEFVILRAFINSRKEKYYENFELALKWNQFEIARIGIITSDLELNKLENLFELALIYDRYEFVEFLLGVGVQLEDFLTEDRWTKLFNFEKRKKEKRSAFWRLLKTEKLTYKNVDENTVKRVVQYLTFDDIEIDYLNKREYAAQNLFLWALLFNRISIAKLFWKIGKYHIINALFASKIFKSMQPHFRDKAEQLTKESSDYEELAIQILKNIDDDTHDVVNNCILLRQVPIYNVDCLQMALNCECKRFVSQSTVQDLLDDIWSGNITLKRFYKNTFSKMIVFILSIFSFGLLTPFFTKISENKLEGIENHVISSEYLKGSKFQSPNDEVMNNVINQSKRKVKQLKMSPTELFFNYSIDYFKSPMIIYIYDLFFHLVFVAVFSYMMLCDYHYYDLENEENKILTTGLEYQLVSFIVDAWMIGIIIEEMRQFLGFLSTFYVNEVRRQTFSNYLRYCVSRYFNDEWNIIDFVGCVLYVIGKSMRYTALYTADKNDPDANEDLYTASRVILSVDLLCWYARSLFYCSASKTLGPKLEIIKNLMKDLLFFVIIIIVVGSAFGVVTQATMFPADALDGDLVKGIIRNAYWPIFGEFRMYDIVLDAENCVEDADSDEECPDETGLIFSLILLLLYPFITLMLMNLLIAMFNSTFDSLHKQTELIWRYQRYYLIFSYCKYPFMLAPLSLFGNPIYFLYKLILFIKNCCKTKYSVNGLQTDPEIENNLVLYEYRCTTEICLKRERKTANELYSIGKRYEEQEKRIFVIENQLKKIYDEIVLNCPKRNDNN